MHGTHANKYVMYLTYFYLYTHMCLCVCVHKERGSGTCGFTRSLAEQKYNKDSMQQIVAWSCKGFAYKNCMCYRTVAVSAQSLHTDSLINNLLCKRNKMHNPSTYKVHV